MPRMLAATRARVSAEHQPEYRRVAAMLAARLQERGQHLWIFRSMADSELLLEFREGGDPAALEPAGEEAALQAQLQKLARYDRAEPLWEEFPLHQKG